MQHLIWAYLLLSTYNWNSEKVFEDSKERYTKDKKVTGEILRNMNPEFSEKDITAHLRMGVLKKAKKSCT